jgi:hypothetical protein
MQHGFAIVRDGGELGTTDSTPDVLPLFARSVRDRFSHDLSSQWFLISIGRGLFNLWGVSGLMLVPQLLDRSIIVCWFPPVSSISFFSAFFINLFVLLTLPLLRNSDGYVVFWAILVSFSNLPAWEVKFLKVFWWIAVQWPVRPCFFSSLRTFHWRFIVHRLKFMFIWYQFTI